MTLPRKKRIANTLYLCISSLAVGWMVGSSVSPVVQVVISSLMTILVAIVALAGGLSEKTNGSAGGQEYIKRLAGMNLGPVATVSVALAIGAASGIFMRTHDYLGVPTTKTDSTGTKKDVAERSQASWPVLYSVEADQLAYIKTCYGKKLERALRDFGDEQTVALVNKCNGDSVCLEIIKEVIWAKEQ